MMKFFLIFFNLIFTLAQAQSGRASFIFSTPKQSFNCEMNFNTNVSVFVLDFDNPISKIESIEKKTPGISNKQTIINVADGKKFFILKDIDKNKLISRELLYNGDKVILNDTLQELNWVMHKDKKYIAGFMCQKATTIFRCAEYTAWFTSQVPVQHGPAKMGGLPGLILELTNETVKHIYTLSKLEYPLNNGEVIDSVNTKNGDKQVDYPEFAKIQKAELRKMEIFLKAQAGNPNDSSFKATIPECFN